MKPVVKSVWLDDGHDEARRSIEESRRTSGLDQTGLHLIHWPLPRLELTHDEVDAITALGRRGGRLWDGHPETTGFM